jgi:hypothetical protein
LELVLTLEVFDVPVPVILVEPSQSKSVAPVGTVAVKITPVPSHLGPSCKGAAGVVGVAMTVPTAL